MGEHLDSYWVGDVDATAVDSYAAILDDKSNKIRKI